MLKNILRGNSEHRYIHWKMGCEGIQESRKNTGDSNVKKKLQMQSKIISHL